MDQNKTSEQNYKALEVYKDILASHLALTYKEAPEEKQPDGELLLETISLLR